MARNRILDNQARRTDRDLSRLTESHMAMLETSIQDLEKRIMRKANKLKTATGDRLMGARTNLKQAQKVHGELKALFEATYGRAARSAVDGFDEISGWIRGNFRELDAAARWTAVDRAMVAQLKRTSFAQYSQYGQEAMDKIAVAMYSHVAAMAPIEELENAISAALTGKLSTSGRPMEAYATQFANDASMNFHRQIEVKKAEDAGIEHFRYMGTVMSETRPFCRARVGKVFSREAIEGWTHKWAGKSGPAMVNCGGHQCRHHWQAVSPDWIDQEIDPPGIMKKERALEPRKRKRQTA